MEIDIYQSAFNSSRFVAVRAGAPISMVPITLPDFAEVAPFKMNHQLQKGAPVLGASTDLVIEAIEESGVAIIGGSVDSTD